MLPIPIRLTLFECSGDQTQLFFTGFPRVREEERERRKHDVFSLAVAEKRWIELRAKHVDLMLNCTCNAMVTRYLKIASKLAL